MPRNPPSIVSPPEGGRPLKPIDWDKADELLSSGCNGVQIAAFFGMHPETFYSRVQVEKGVGFTVYASEKREKGNSLLLDTQFKLALEKDRTMLIWLGKQRLGQREEPKKEEEFSGELKEFMEYMKKKYELKENEKGEFVIGKVEDKSDPIYEEHDGNEGPHSS